MSIILWTTKISKVVDNCLYMLHIFVGDSVLTGSPRSCIPKLIFKENVWAERIISTFSPL